MEEIFFGGCCVVSVNLLKYIFGKIFICNVLHSMLIAQKIDSSVE